MCARLDKTLELEIKKLQTGQLENFSLVQFIFSRARTKEFSAPWSFVYTLPPNNPFQTENKKQKPIHSIISERYTKRRFFASDGFYVLLVSRWTLRWKKFISGTHENKKKGLKYKNDEIQWHTPFPSLYSCSWSALTSDGDDKSSHDGRNFFIHTQSSMDWPNSSRWSRLVCFFHYHQAPATHFISLLSTSSIHENKFEFE